MKEVRMSIDLLSMVTGIIIGFVIGYLSNMVMLSKKKEKVKE
jgi:F0F1-type ATP synthase assembly protein I